MRIATLGGSIQPRCLPRHNAIGHVSGHTYHRGVRETQTSRPLRSVQSLKADLAVFRRTCDGRRTQQGRTAQARAAAPDPQSDAPVRSEYAKNQLSKAARACRRIGWFSFWTQLSLTIVSAGILLFSVAFTSQNGPAVSLYLTLFGIVAGFVSTFWSFGYTRLSRRLKGYLQGELRRVRKSDVIFTLQNGCWINILGMASTLLGLQATVGLLVAKTLTNATANPFLAGGAGSYNPVLALDVFLVQASTNTLLAHFASLVCNLYVLRVVTDNPPLEPEQLGAAPARA